MEQHTSSPQDDLRAAEASHAPAVHIEEPFWRHRRALVWCIISCFGGLQLGLDLGSIAGMQAMPGFLAIFGYKDATSVLGYNISPKVQQLISSLMSIGAFVTCAGAGFLGRFIGRRWSLMLGVVLNHVSVIMMMLAPNIGVLYAGRLIAGFANGILDIFPQLYIHESAAASQRGSLLGVFNVLVGIGLLVGSITDNYTATLMGRESFQIPLGLFFIMPTILAVLLPFMPETPRWLVEHNQVPAARKALVRLRNKETTPAMIDLELDQIISGLEKEREHSQSVALFDLFRGTNLRRTLLSLGLLSALCGSGSLFFLAYGTYFFAMAGQSKPFEENVGVTVGGLVGTILSLWLITRISRRMILLTGTAAQGICMLVIAAAYQAKPGSVATGRCLVGFVVIYLFFYNMCTAPYLYLVAGEIPSQRLRGYTLGLAIGLAFFLNWLVSYTAPYFINTASMNWGPKYAWIWFGSNVVIFIFIFFLVPETKDRTLEEIDEMFEAHLQARKFKNYVSTRTVSSGGVAAASDKQGTVELVEKVNN